MTKNIFKPICSQPAIRNSYNNWVKTDIQEAHTFANHLSNVFSPNPIMPSNDVLQELNQVLAETIDSNTPIKRFSNYEIKSVINSLEPRNVMDMIWLQQHCWKIFPRKNSLFLHISITQFVLSPDQPTSYSGNGVAFS